MWCWFWRRRQQILKGTRRQVSTLFTLFLYLLLLSYCFNRHLCYAIAFQLEVLKVRLIKFAFLLIPVTLKWLSSFYWYITFFYCFRRREAQNFQATVASFYVPGNLLPIFFNWINLVLLSFLVVDINSRRIMCKGMTDFFCFIILCLTCNFLMRRFALLYWCYL